MNNSLLNTVLSVVTLLLVAFNTFGGSMGVQKAIEDVEAMKVWGAENYAIVKEIYASEAFKSQQKQSLEAAKTQMAWAAVEPTDTAQPTETQPAAAKTLTDDQIAAIQKIGYWKGNKDARILFLEYSDLECPFCKRHHDNNTVEWLMDKYKDKIYLSFRNFPLSFHPLAAPGANATYCVADQGWADKYFAFVDAVFTKGLTSEQVLFDSAKELGMDEAKFKTCMDEKPFAATRNAEMTEGQQLFAVNGTPGNVMINLDTKEYVVVAGAYPASEFEKTLDQWVK